MRKLYLPAFRRLFLALTTASLCFTAPAFAQSLHELSPEQIAADVERQYNSETGRTDYVGQSFDPFEGSDGLAGSASLRSVTPGHAISGRYVSSGAVVDMSVIYGSNSSDRYDVHGFDQARFVTGEPADVMRYDNQVLNCSRDIREVTYDKSYYSGASYGFIGGIYRHFPRYRGHSHYRRHGLGYWGSRGHYGSRGHGYRGWRHGSGHHDGRGSGDRDRRDRDERDRDDRDRDDRDREDRRDRDWRPHSYDGNGRVDRRDGGDFRRRIGDGRLTNGDEGGRGRGGRGDSGNSGGSNGVVKIKEKAPYVYRRPSGIPNLEEAYGRSKPTTTGGSSTTSKSPKTYVPPVSRRRLDYGSKPKSPVVSPPSRPSTSYKAPSYKPVSRPISRPVSKPTYKPSPKPVSRPAPKTYTPPKVSKPVKVSKPSRPTVSRKTDKTFQSRNKSFKRSRDFYPRVGGYARTDVYVSENCVKEETLSVHIPLERLQAGRFEGLTLLLVDRSGQDVPVYLPPNYVSGFLNAAGPYLGGSYRSSTYSAPYQSSAPVSQGTVTYSNESQSTVGSYPISD